MFTVVNAVLLRPLPFRDPQRLLALSEYDTRTGDPKRNGSDSYANIADVRIRSHSFEDAAAFDSSGRRSHRYVRTAPRQFRHVNTSLFRLLGVQPFMAVISVLKRISRVTTSPR